MLTGLITIQRSKSNQSRQVPMSSLVGSALIDLDSRRARPGDATEDVFDSRPVQRRASSMPL